MSVLTKILVILLVVLATVTMSPREVAGTWPRCLSILPLCSEGCYVPTTPLDFTSGLTTCLKDAKDTGQCQGCRDKATGAAGYCL